jgi:hypothetical protein
VKILFPCFFFRFIIEKRRKRKHDDYNNCFFLDFVVVVCVDGVVVVDTRTDLGVTMPNFLLLRTKSFTAFSVLICLKSMSACLLVAVDVLEGV